MIDLGWNILARIIIKLRWIFYRKRIQNNTDLECLKVAIDLKRDNSKIKIFSYKELNNYVKNSKKNDTCHIIATGYSAYLSYKEGVIKDSDYIIGFNYAAYLPHKFDIYFVEQTAKITPEKYERVTDNLMQLLSKRRDKVKTIFLKNIYSSSSKILTTTMFEKTEKDINVVLDKQIIENVVEKLFATPSIFMPQYSTTTITAVLLAFHAGFKNIIVHGLDFEGPHIYHSEELQNQVNMQEIYPYVKSEIKHGTAASQELVWEDIIENLKKRNVNIYSASSESNFKKYAPVYKFKS